MGSPVPNKSTKKMCAGAAGGRRTIAGLVYQSTVQQVSMANGKSCVRIKLPSPRWNGLYASRKIHDLKRNNIRNHGFQILEKYLEMFLQILQFYSSTHGERGSDSPRDWTPGGSMYRTGLNIVLHNSTMTSGIQRGWEIPLELKVFDGKIIEL